jgi:hypothetical protein
MAQMTELMLVTFSFVAGFLTGYGVRAGISHHHRVIAGRARMDGIYNTNPENWQAEVAA